MLCSSAFIAAAYLIALGADTNFYASPLPDERIHSYSSNIFVALVVFLSVAIALNVTVAPRIPKKAGEIPAVYGFGAIAVLILVLFHINGTDGIQHLYNSSQGAPVVEEKEIVGLNIQQGRSYTCYAIVYVSAQPGGKERLCAPEDQYFKASLGDHIKLHELRSKYGTQILSYDLLKSTVPGTNA